MFNERLKLLRKKHNLTQSALAEILGIAKTTLAAYEQGKNEPSMDMIKKIATYFNVSTDYLLNLTGIATPNIKLSYISNYLGLSIKSIESLHTLTQSNSKVASQQLNTVNLLFSEECNLLSQISNYLNFTATHFKNFYDNSPDSLEPISELELWDAFNQTSYSDDWDMWSKALLLIIEEELIYFRKKNITEKELNFSDTTTE